MWKKIIGGLLILGIGLFVAGALYNRGDNDYNKSAQNVSAESPRGSADADVRAAPGFSLDKLGGGIINLADYKGKKPVVLDFWASWCPNCQRDMPHLNALYQTYKDKVEVIGIDLQEDAATVQQFVASRGLDFPIALDQLSQASQAYGIRYTNTHVLIDKSGNLVRVIPGDIQESDIASLIGG